MKRFILDIFLILIVVSVGSTLNQQKPVSTIEQKMEEFNQQVQQQEIVGQNPQDRSAMYQIHENPAGRLGENVSDLVINMVEGSVRMIASAFGQ